MPTILDGTALGISATCGIRFFFDDWEGITGFSDPEMPIPPTAAFVCVQLPGSKKVIRCDALVGADQARSSSEKGGSDR